MTLIADNRPGRDPESIIMIDDGTGLSIAIPTVIITKEFGDDLKKTVQDVEENNNNPTNKKDFVVLLVDFKMDNPDDRVEYDIWYTSGDATALNYIISMKAYNDKLGKNALMTPHMIVRTCSFCTNQDPNCKSHGTTIYCAGFSNNLPISGSASLSLGIEEHCIYDIYKDVNNGEMWWDYMKEVYGCRDKKYSDPCISTAKQYIGIDISKLAMCKYREAQILEKEAENWLSSGIPYSPAVIINNRVFRVISY